MGDFLQLSIDRSKIVGKEHVILGLSGGVDSSVAAALIHKAIGETDLHFCGQWIARLNEESRLLLSLGIIFLVS